MRTDIYIRIGNIAEEPGKQEARRFEFWGPQKEGGNYANALILNSYPSRAFVDAV